MTMINTPSLPSILPFAFLSCWFVDVIFLIGRLLIELWGWPRRREEEKKWGDLSNERPDDLDSWIERQRVNASTQREFI